MVSWARSAICSPAVPSVANGPDMGYLKKVHVCLLSGCCVVRISWDPMDLAHGQDGVFHGLPVFFFVLGQIAVFEALLMPCGIPPKVAGLPEHGMRFL